MARNYSTFGVREGTAGEKRALRCRGSRPPAAACMLGAGGLQRSGAPAGGAGGDEAPQQAGALARRQGHHLRLASSSA